MRFIAIFFSFEVLASVSPSVDDMKMLSPAKSMRLHTYDQISSTAFRESELAHQNYTDPNILNDLNKRLNKVSKSGDPKSVFTDEEWQQFELNLSVLKSLEENLFKRWHLKFMMDKMIGFQKRLTRMKSPVPESRLYKALEKQLLGSLNEDLLYGNWNKSLPAEHLKSEGPKTWGDLILSFNNSEFFRKHWVINHTQSLPFLKKLMERYAWEDSSVRSVTVVDQGLLTEHWTLERIERENTKNKFNLSLDRDVRGLIDLEFSETVFFNRVSRISRNGSEYVYEFESIEKGRTMELQYSEKSNLFERKLFQGANFLRSTKSDELLQRKYIGYSLSLFLGPRALQFDQIRELTKLNPELVSSVGQFGFSITGGRAQMTSVRTDKPEEQLRKFTASLIDLIEFAKTKDVESWFDLHKKYLYRAVSTGVGSGGQTALDPKRTALTGLKGLSCVKFL